MFLITWIKIWNPTTFHPGMRYNTYTLLTLIPTKSEHMNFKSEIEKMFLIQEVYSSYCLYECLWFWLDLKYKNCNIISHTKTYKLTFKENLTCCASLNNLYLSGTVIIRSWSFIIYMICTVFHKGASMK